MISDSYEYVILEDEFCQAFREPLVIRLFSKATGGVCFQLGKTKSRSEEETHPMIRAFLSVVDHNCTYCFPPNSPKLSINAFLSMSTFVEEMLQKEISKMISLAKTHKHVSARKLYRVQINPLNRHQEKIRITTGELIRLRQELLSGFCHGHALEDEHHGTA
tara:strand:+ start:629 stop:1114 length:486 start_codon:yes stop_codon:yes gene_type:complete